MSAAQAHEAERTLDDFLVSLYPRSVGRKPGAWDPFFRFVNDIQTLSKLPATVECLLWGLCYSILFVMMGLGSVNLDLFDAVAFRGDYGAFFGARLSGNQAALTLIAVSVLIIGYQCVMFLFSVQRQDRLDGFNATLLHLFLHHLNVLLTITLGVVFGVMIVSNIEEYSSQFSSMMLAIAIVTLLIPIMVLQTFYAGIARFSLAMGRGQFQHWELPLGVSDIFFAFYMSMNLVLYWTQTKVYKTLGCAVTILFGLAKFRYEKAPTFVSMLAEVLKHAYNVSLILWPMLGLLTAWSQITLKASLFVLTVVMLVSIAIACFVVRWKFDDKKYGIRHMKDGSFDFLSLSTPSAALTAVRLCLTLGIPFVADEDFLKWICLWRFSKKLVPDIVRLCLECKIPLKNIPIPRVTLDQYSVIGMKYLAYQVKIELDRYSHDEDANVKLVAEELTTDVSRAKRLLQEFWTNKDMEHLTIMDLSIQLNQITNKFKMAALTFPYSERIKALRNEFAESVVFSVNELKTPDRENAGSVLCGRDSLYCFLKKNESPSEGNVIPDLDKETAVEWYLRNQARKSTYPFMFFVYFILVLTIVVHIIYGELTITQSKSDWDLFTNVTSLLTMMFEVSNEQLAIIDNSIALPDISVVMSVLGITQDEAAEFLGNHVERNPKLADYTKSFIYLNDTSCSISVDGCPNVSMVLALKYLVPFEEMSPDIRICRIVSFKIFYEKIEESIGAIQERMTHLAPFMQGKYGIFTIVIVVFSLVMFITFAFLDISGYRKMLRAVRHIAANKPQRKEYSKMDYSFNFALSFVLWIVFTVFLICLYVAYYYPLKNAETSITEVLGQMRQIAQISASAMHALTYLEVNISGGTWPEGSDLTSLFHSECEKVVEGTKQVTNDGIKPIFRNVLPLSEWNIEGRSLSIDLLDFGVMLRSKSNIQIDSFEFLYARLLYMQSIASLYTSGNAGMVDAGQKSMQMITTTYLFASLAIIVCMVICTLIFHYNHNRKQIWYFGCSVLLKQAVFEDPSKFNMLVEILEKPNQNFLEKLPFPVVMRDQNGRIVYANQQTRPFTDYNPHQLVGQPLEQMFHIENGLVRSGRASLMMTCHQMEPDRELILMHDITQLIDKRTMYTRFAKRMKANIELPVRDEMYCIELRLPPPDDPPALFAAFDNAEEALPDVTRIACGLTFYLAIAPANLDPNRLLEFVLRILPDRDSSIASILFGLVSVFSLQPDGTLPVIAGVPVERAHDIVIHGSLGLIYVDESILARMTPSDDERIISLSPRHLTSPVT